MAGKRKRYTPPGGGPRPKKKKYDQGYKVVLAPRITGATFAAGPLGKSQKATLYYSSRFTLDPNQSFVYALNNLYDPFVTGGGHQPRGLDQLFKMFDAAVVINAKVEFWGVSNGEPIMMCATVRDTATTTIDYRDVLEEGWGAQTLLGNAGNDGRKLEFTVNPNKFLGRSKPLSDPDLKNTAVNGPTEQAYIHLHNINFDATGTSRIKCVMRVTYTAVFIEPKLAPIS